jgi:CDP-6-deoxy-D-xylo-4-hexulose-3-dehydrase
MKIPLSQNLLNSKDINEAIKVLRSGNLTMGKNNTKFEKIFARTVGSKYSLMVNSGSSANLLSLFTLVNPLFKKTSNFKKIFNNRSEVIVPALSWPTSIWPIVQAGLVPVLVDCETTTLQMKQDSFEKALSKNTIGVVAVHVLGSSIDLGWLKKICKKKKLWVVEDSCEALGAKYKNKFLGTFGDIGTYSFYFSHHITTIEGGMLVTNDRKIYEVAKSLRAHGWIRDLKNKKFYIKKFKNLDPKFLFINSGFNFRSTEINAALGISQLKKLKKFNLKREEIYNYWVRALNKLNITNIFENITVNKYVTPAIFGFPIICKNKMIKDKLKNFLEKNGIETRPIICGNMARHPAIKLFKHKIVDNLEGANNVTDRGLFWSVNPLTSKVQQNYLIKTVKRFLK